jgi:spore germination cell wall hydrolase CwlJ-like protein
VKLELRLLGVFSALLLSTAAAGVGPAPMFLRLDDVITPAPISLPSFSIPKYALPASEREIVAACLVLEAADQGDFGLRSVMSVIRNRARGMPELFAPTVLRVKQFSALNRLTAGRETLPRLLARARRDAMWERALAIVDDAVHESWHDPTGGATHYTRVGERTPWTRRLAHVTTIGAHAFYR